MWAWGEINSKFKIQNSKLYSYREASYVQRLVEKKKTGGDVALASRRVGDGGKLKLKVSSSKAQLPSSEVQLPSSEVQLPSSKVQHSSSSSHAQCPMPNTNL